MSKTTAFFCAPAKQNLEERCLYQRALTILRGLGYHISYDWVNDSEDYDVHTTTMKSIKAIEISDIVIAESTSLSAGVSSQITYALSKKSLL